MLCSGTLNGECGCISAPLSKDSSQNASSGSTRYSTTVVAIYFVPYETIAVGSYLVLLDVAFGVT